MIGERFGRWKAQEKIKKYNNSTDYYLCECDCGTIKPVRKSHLKSGESLSCGCYTVDLRREKTKNHIGERHGDWTIIGIDEEEKSKKFYICKCKCGTIKKIRYVALSSGKSKSCGCSKANLTDEQLERLQSMTDASREKHLYKGINIANIRTTHLSEKTKSGVNGVYQRENGKWIARLGFKGKIIHLGTFETQEEAIEARLMGEEKYYKPMIEDFYKEYR